MDLLDRLSTLNLPGGAQIRSPYGGELDYFRKNPNVAGMATEDNKVILNQLSGLDYEQLKAVAMNEAFRLWMKNHNFQSSMNVTNEQKNAFANTPYANNDLALQQTILARILSGDPSALNATQEQNTIAGMLSNAIGQR